MAEGKQNVIEVLTQDHREVQEMFSELTAATDPAERRRVLDDATIELVRHSVAEGMYLYPAVRDNVPAETRSPTRRSPTMPRLNAS